MSERVIEPYHLVQTRRGWEVDAGPLDADGQLRTFLLSNIRSVEVLEGTFEIPGNLPQLLESQRATTTVRARLPQSSRWAADMYAEQVSVVEEDELTAVLDLELLPPVEQRVGLLVLVADASVVSPARLGDAGAQLAAELIRHHSRTE